MAEVSADTGWISASSASSDGAGSYVWSGLTNVGASDNARASVSLPSSGLTSDRLNCAFSLLASAIPDGATIDGVEARVECYRSSTNVRTTTLSLCSDTAGTVIADTSSKNITVPAGSSTAEAYVSTGSDLWGAGSIAESALTDSAFRLSVLTTDSLGSGALYADHVQIKVYYTYTEPELSGASLFWGI